MISDLRNLKKVNFEFLNFKDFFLKYKETKIYIFKLKRILFFFKLGTMIFF